MIQILKASTDDVQILQRLNNEVIVDNGKYDDDLIPDWALSERGRAYFTKELHNKDSICFIAQEDNNPVGYIMATPKHFSYRKSSCIEIANMGVVPLFRSKGVGKQLIDKVINDARSRGYKKIYVNSYFQNAKAITFYKRSGFYEIDLSLERSL